MSTVERLRELPPRTWLFVPALRAPEWLPKAVASGADAVIVDLEDATAPEEKGRAAAVVRELSLDAYGDVPIFVRVNASADARAEGGAHASREDIAAARTARAAGIVIPKASSPDDIASVPRWSAQAILVMVETARGVLRALDLADSDPRVVGLAFGGEDLSAELGVTRTREVGELASARALVALAAAAAAVSAVDTPWLDLADPAGAAREASAARQLGFTGKLVIHPSHVASVNDAFLPDGGEVARARRIIEAFDEAVAGGRGVATLDGRMIDRPVVVAARRVLGRAERGRPA